MATSRRDSRLLVSTHHSHAGQLIKTFSRHVSLQHAAAATSVDFPVVLLGLGSSILATRARQTAGAGDFPEDAKRD